MTSETPPTSDAPKRAPRKKAVKKTAVKKAATKKASTKKKASPKKKATAKKVTAKAAPTRALITGAEVTLDDRDPEFIRRQLPIWWLIATMYHRAEVEGLDQVPDGPVLLVGNHSGGSVPIDSMIAMLAWNTFFTVERPLYALAHAMVTGLPVLGDFARKIGAVTAGPDAAGAILNAGHSAMVYPGGDVEVMRPWSKRHTIDFDNRKGFLRIAHEHGVPIVPIVADGGHDTFVVLNDGKWLAKALRMDKIGRVKTMPIALALPWGITIGDWFGHIPFPAKIRLQVLEPIDLRERYGDDLDQDDAYKLVTSRMQAGLTKLVAKRTFGAFR